MATIGTDADDSLVGSSADEIFEGGDGNDEIDGRGGNDTALGGNGDDTVFGGTGNDVLSGDLGADQLFGLVGDDGLVGGDGIDDLSGGTGNDVLDGGAGADQMDGGAGHDRYVVDDTGDTITEEPGALQGGIDTVISSATFRLPDNVERLILTGADPISGTGNDLQNRITGNGARNVLRAGDAIDVLAGAGGNDFLDGGRDADTMVGGADSDTYIVDDLDDAVVEAALGGLADRVLSSVDYTLPAYVEELTLRGRATLGIGNAFANVITGNASANSLRGGRGDDTLLAAGGNDVLDGGADSDDLQCGLGSDTAFGGDGSDTIGGDVGRDVPGGSADRLSGGDGSDVIFGDQGNDQLFGEGQLDNLFGGEGNDQLYGGGGSDHLDGGAGDDTLDGGAHGRLGDLALFSEETAPVRVDLARGIATTGTGRDTLISIEGAIGGSGNDRLVGDGNENQFIGGDGNDILIGGVAGISGGTQVPGNGALVGGLGGIRGFGENVLDRQDDSPSAPVDITSVFGADGISFFGRQFTSLFVNNNGNITFAAPQSTFTPPVITGATANPIIAPFFADVDTRLPADNSGEPQPPANADLVYWDLDPARKTFTVTWDSVGYFSLQTEKLNSFQLQLIDRGGAGDFDIVFRYQAINWTTGNASGGTDGLGGTVARAGYSAGDGTNFQELPAAGDQAAVLALDTAAGNTGRRGLWVFEVRNGAVAGDADILAGGEGDDILVGGLGNDLLIGGNGADRFDYANRNEGGDTIDEFDLDEDVIDLSRVVTGFVPGQSQPGQFVQLEQVFVDDPPGEDRTDTRLKVDFDGGGNQFVDFLTLRGVSGLTVEALAASGALDFVA